MTEKPFVRGPVPRGEDRVLLTGGRIVNVENGQYLPDEVRIVLRNGEIEALGA